MADKVVVDVTRLTETVLRPPVYIQSTLLTKSLVQNESNKLFEFHVVSSVR